MSGTTMTTQLQHLSLLHREDLSGPVVTSTNAYWDVRRAAWVLTPRRAARPVGRGAVVRSEEVVR